MRGLVLLAVLGLLLQAGLASAAIDFNPIEKSYRPGDYVKLGGIYRNNHTESRSVKIEQVLLHKELDPMPGISEGFLGPGRISVIKGLGFTVQNITDSGIYTYSVTVYEGETPVESASISFEIVESQRRFEGLRVRVCDSPDCKWFKSIFAVETPAYIRVFNSGDAKLTGHVEDDLGFRRDLDFMGGIAEFKLERTGHFRVWVIAEAGGYRGYDMEMDFYVIEGNFVLTDFFPMFNWLYNLMFVVIALTIIITVILSVVRGKKKDRLEEWLRWRRWRRDEIGYILGSGKRP